MKVDVKLPQLGESLTEGTILKWWKKVGEPVQKDEILLEISTDKVDSEIPSPATGTLAEIVARENETVEVNAVIARIETGAEAPAGTGEKTQKKVQETPGSEEIRRETKEEKQPSAAAVTSGKLVDVRMPKLGESLTEGTILKWWKQPGDQVKKEETLLEVSTDKVDSEIPSPVEGVLKEIMAQENETVEINQVIARIESAGASAAEEPAEKEEVSASEKMPSPSRKISAPEAEEPEEISARSEGRFYSPLVRNIARQENVSQSELDQLPGSGAGGRVTKKDILNYLEMRKAEPAARPAATERLGAAEGEARTTAAGQREMIIPMDAVRKRIAVHMRQSLDTSAHVYSVSECDMTRVMQIMYARRPEFERTEGFKLTITPLVLYAVTKALLDFPRVNSSLEGDNIIEKRYINLGLAVAAHRGLIVPVVKSAEEKSFRGLARSVNDLIVRTRENRLTVDDVQGATYSVTNYGIFGNIIGLPIINQPNVAILGLGAIKKRPVVIESEAGDSIAIRSMAYISMSYDHRVVDGELGGRFMQRLVEYLENFSGEIL